MSTTKVPVRCRLKELLNERGLTQMDLVRQLGLSPTTVGKLYNNKSGMIAFETIDKLCDFFEIGIQELLIKERKGQSN